MKAFLGMGLLGFNFVRAMINRGDTLPSQPSLGSHPASTRTMLPMYKTTEDV